MLMGFYVHWFLRSWVLTFRSSTLIGSSVQGLLRSRLLTFRGRTYTVIFRELL